MKRSALIVLGLLVLLVSGCQTPKSGPQPSPTNPQSAESTVTPVQLAASTPTPLQQNPSLEATLPAKGPAPTATLSGVSPTATQPAASPKPASPAASPTPPNPAAPNVTQPAPVLATQTSNCTDRATFEADVTIPDNTVFQPGETFVKTWQLYNSGTCAWGEGYALSFAYGDSMGAAQSSPLPVTAPGASVEVSLDMTAPASAGQHAGNWQLQNAAGQHFGVGATGTDYFWAQVVVSYVGSSPGAAAAPTQSAPGSGGSTSTSPGGCTSTSDPQATNEILQQINSIRTTHGLAALTRQSQLDAAAMDYSLDMACNNRVDFTHHTDSQGGRWYERISAQGYAYSKAFENVYTGNPAYGGTPQSAMNWWMNSPIHRDNILNPDVSEIGIAYAYTDTSDYGGYYTVDFAAP